jgi:hypothetical protein
MTATPPWPIGRPLKSVRRTVAEDALTDEVRKAFDALPRLGLLNKVVDAMRFTYRLQYTECFELARDALVGTPHEGLDIGTWEQHMGALDAASTTEDDLE